MLDRFATNESCRRLCLCKNVTALIYHTAWQPVYLRFIESVAASSISEFLGCQAGAYSLCATLNLFRLYC